MTVLRDYRHTRHTYTSPFLNSQRLKSGVKASTSELQQVSSVKKMFTVFKQAQLASTAIYHTFILSLMPVSTSSNLSNDGLTNTFLSL